MLMWLYDRAEGRRLRFDVPRSLSQVQRDNGGSAGSAAPSGQPCSADESARDDEDRWWPLVQQILQRRAVVQTALHLWNKLSGT